MGKRTAAALGWLSNLSVGRRALRWIPVWIEVRTRTASFKYFSPANDDLRLRALADFDGWEDCGRNVLIDTLRQVKTVVDVGAYTGVYSLTAASHNSEVSVLAIEPAKRSARAIERSAAANGFKRISVIRAAASDTDGETVGLIAGKDRGASTRSVEPKFHVGPTKIVERPKTIRLDSLGLAGIDFLKIDVEGHEYAVIAGAEGVLRKFGPIVLVECLDENALSLVLEKLRRCGYREPSLIDRTKKNYLFVPDFGQWSQWYSSPAIDE